MRNFINIISEAGKPSPFKDKNLSPAVVKKMNIEHMRRWEITTPKAMFTNTVEHELGRSSDGSWRWCADAINELRAMCGLPSHDLQPPSQEEFVAKSPKTILHGTSREAAEKIATNGLQPRLGEFVKNVHGTNHPEIIYGGILRDFHRIVAAMYVASGRPETDDEFFENAALIFLINDGRWFTTKSGHPSPAPVEDGDFYRYETIQPSRILVGDELRAFFEKRIGRMPSEYIDFMGAV